MAGTRATPNKKTGKYQAWFIDSNGRQRFFTGTTNRKETLAVARKLEDDHRLVRLKIRPAPKPSDKPRDFSPTAAEYIAWGRAQGGKNGKGWAGEHGDKREAKLKWWQGKLSLKTIQDLIGIQGEVEKQTRALIAGGCTSLTARSYTDALTAFCDWCFKREYLDDDPLKRFQAPARSVKTPRRALTIQEVQLLVAKCKPTRRLLYQVAISTGLRANELRSLTAAHVDAVRGGLRLDEEWTKNRKTGFQYLPASVLKTLVERLSVMTPNAPLLHVGRHTARDLDCDLAAAGIPKKTASGKIDFHALRVAYTTFILEAGATVKEAMALARHATPDLTLNTYGRARDERLAEVAENVGVAVFTSSVSVKTENATSMLQPAATGKAVSAKTDKAQTSGSAVVKRALTDALPPYFQKLLSQRRAGITYPSLSTRRPSLLPADFR